VGVILSKGRDVRMIVSQDDIVQVILSEENIERLGVYRQREK
jgi:hypothetical protein